MKKEKIIKMLSSAFDEIGRLRVENRRLLNETKDIADRAEEAMKKLAEAHEANAELCRALQQAEKSKEKAEMALKLANANAATLAKQTVDLAKERDAALRRAEKAEDEQEMRSETEEYEARIVLLKDHNTELKTALERAHQNERKLAGEILDFTKERDAALRRAEKAEDEQEMRSEGKERIATVAVLPRNDGEEALLTAAEKNYAPTPLSETAEAGTRDKTYADIWHSWLAERIRGER